MVLVHFAVVLFSHKGNVSDKLMTTFFFQKKKKNPPCILTSFAFLVGSIPKRPKALQKKKIKTAGCALLLQDKFESRMDFHKVQFSFNHLHFFFYLK